MARGNRYPRHLVVDVAIACISGIEKDREEAKERLIAKYMKPHRKFWLFGPKIARTREQAIQRAKEDNDLQCWDWWSAENLYSNTYEQLKKLLAAAEGCSTRGFWLTIDEFSLISSGWPTF